MTEDAVSSTTNCTSLRPIPAKWGPEKDLRSYPLRYGETTSELRWRKNDALFSFEWESAVRILIPWLKFARRSSIRSSESFERLRQRRESCLIRWGEKSRWKWYIVSPHLGQFISIPFIFFFSLLVWFFIRQNYFYDLKTRFWKRVTLNTEKFIKLEMIFFVRRRLDEKFEIFEI